MGRPSGWPHAPPDPLASYHQGHHTPPTPFHTHSLLFCVRHVACLQSEVILRCGLSPYQSALYDTVKAALRAERAKDKQGQGPGAVAAARGVKGVNNTVMELRNICNHPMLRWGGDRACEHQQLLLGAACSVAGAASSAAAGQ